MRDNYNHLFVSKELSAYTRQEALHQQVYSWIWGVSDACWAAARCMGYISRQKQKAAFLKQNLCGLAWELILSDEQESKVGWGGGGCERMGGMTQILVSRLSQQLGHCTLAGRA